MCLLTTGTGPVLVCIANIPSDTPLEKINSDDTLLYPWISALFIPHQRSSRWQLTQSNPQLENVQRDFRALSPKWDVVIKPIYSRFSDLEEEAGGRKIGRARGGR